MNHRRKFIASAEEIVSLLQSGLTEEEVAKHYKVPVSNIHYYARRLNEGSDVQGLVCGVCNKTFSNRMALGGHRSATGHRGGLKKQITNSPTNYNGISEEKIMSTIIQGLQNAVMGYKRIPELEEEITELKHNNKGLLSSCHQLANERNRWQLKAESFAKRQVEIQQVLSRPN